MYWDSLLYTTIVIYMIWVSILLVMTAMAQEMLLDDDLVVADKLRSLFRPSVHWTEEVRVIRLHREEQTQRLDFFRRDSLYNIFNSQVAPRVFNSSCNLTHGVPYQVDTHANYPNQYSYPSLDLPAILFR